MPSILAKSSSISLEGLHHPQRLFAIKGTIQSSAKVSSLQVRLRAMLEQQLEYLEVASSSTGGKMEWRPRIHRGIPLIWVGAELQEQITEVDMVPISRESEELVRNPPLILASQTDLM